MRPVAAIDMGTNSTRLLIREAGGRELEREMHITRLGQGVDQTGELAEQAIVRTLRVLGDFKRLLERHAVERLRVTATSAARDAKNREAFFQAVRRELRCEPELLSGQDEARLSFLGARLGMAREQGPFLVFDIGGGSTEISVGSDQVDASCSLDLGSVRISERFLHGDPPSTEELESAYQTAHRAFAAERQRLAPERAREWLGLAGTVTSLAALAAGVARYQPEVTHGFTLERARIEAMFQRLARIRTSRREKLLLEPKRAETILGGVVVLRALLDALGARRIRASERDILDGLAASLL